MVAKPQMKDVSYAARHRDIITRIAESAINRLRPEPRLGKVYDYDPATFKAQVLFPGETVDSLVTVNFGANTAPLVRMADTYASQGYDAPGDIVRIAGKPGRYYIDGFVSGYAQNYRYEASVVPIGGIIQYPLATAPMYAFDYYSKDRWLPCDGRMLDPTVYPDLFAVLGTSVGGDGVSTFQLPKKSGEWDDADLVLSDNFVTAASGWSVTAATFARRGNNVSFAISFSRTGAAISSASNGNIANVTLGTLASSNNFPAVQASGTTGSAGIAVLGYVAASDGSIGISNLPPAVGIATGDGISLNVSYTLNAPTNRIKMIRVA